MERAFLPETGQIAALSSHALYLTDRIGRAIGRQTFPIMVFLLVEGFYQTKSRIRYLGRLILAALLSELPYQLAFCRGEVGSLMDPSHNTIWTLAMGFAAIWTIDVVFMRKVREENDSSLAVGKWKMTFRAVAAAAVTAGIYWCAERTSVDYAGAGVIAVVLCYLLRGLSWAGPVSAYVWLGCSNWYEWFALPACLLMCRYNGVRYPERVEHWQQEARPVQKKLLRYVFYLFYPIHLLAVWGLRVLVFGS